MPGEKTTAPSVLPDHAAEIWRAAFDSAWTGTCKSKAANQQQEACAAAVAWTAVKEGGYKKGKDGDWIERTFAEQEIDIGNIPLPGSLYESPASAAKLWIRAFTISMQANQDIAESASRAWDALKSKYANGAEGVWKPRNDVTVEPASEEAEEVVMAEPIVSRSAAAGASYQIEGTSIILDDVAPEQEDFYIRESGYESAERPADWPWEDWSNRTMLARTVEAVIRHRRECRAYLDAVERVKKQGWTPTINQNGSGERIFKGWNVQSPVQRTWTSVILVCKIDAGTDPNDWEMQVISNTQSSTLMARVAPGYRRFRGPVIK